MSYLYNRASFLAVQPVGSLATTYCQLIALELALKEELNGLNSQVNGGHDVPSLMTLLVQSSARPGVVARKAELSSLRSELITRMKDIYCQDKFGKCRSLATSQRSYPNIRYVRHHTGAWHGKTTSDIDLTRFGQTVSKIVIAVSSSGVPL